MRGRGTEPPPAHHDPACIRRVKKAAMQRFHPRTGRGLRWSASSCKDEGSEEHYAKKEPASTNQTAVSTTTKQHTDCFPEQSSRASFITNALPVRKQNTRRKRLYNPVKCWYLDGVCFLRCTARAAQDGYTPRRYTDRMKPSSYASEPLRGATPLTTNKHLIRWVEKMADLCRPDSIHWVDGSKAEYDEICERLVNAGTFRRTEPEEMAGMLLCAVCAQRCGPGGRSHLHLFLLAHRGRSDQ